MMVSLVVFCTCSVELINQYVLSCLQVWSCLGPGLSKVMTDRLRPDCLRPGRPLACSSHDLRFSRVERGVPSFLPWVLFTVVSPRAMNRLGKDGRELSLSPEREGCCVVRCG